MVAYIIHQDTYRPFASIRSAQKALEQGLKRPLIVTDRGIAPLPILAEFVGGLDGLEATRRLLIGSDDGAVLPPVPPRVVILTTFDVDEYVYAALQAGAVTAHLTRVPGTNRDADTDA